MGSRRGELRSGVGRTLESAARRSAAPALPALSILVAVLLPAGCSSDRDESAVSSEPQAAYERVFSGGPVSMTVRLDRLEIDLADRVRLEQELVIEEGFEADFPEYLPEDFEGFAVVDIERPARIDEGGDPSRDENGEEEEVGARRPGTENAAAGEESGEEPAVRVLRKRFVLEPDRSGELVIAPMDVFFRREGEERESSFRTDEVVVSVERIEDLAALDVRPRRGILEAPPEEGGSNAALWAAGGAALLAGGGLAAWALFFRKRRRPAPPPVPPHEVAWESLRRLVALDLVAKGEIEAFYVHLSAILRRYIEARFRVHAEELTTEEFFEAAARAPGLAPYRDRLRQFLDLCDQVKFARFEPDERVIQESFDVLKKFIEETSGTERTQRAA